MAKLLPPKVRVFDSEQAALGHYEDRGWRIVSYSTAGRAAFVHPHHPELRVTIAGYPDNKFRALKWGDK